MSRMLVARSHNTAAERPHKILWVMTQCRIPEVHTHDNIFDFDNG